MTECHEYRKTRTLSLQLTQKCNAACGNCGTFSSPSAKARLSPGLVEEAIRQAARSDFREVVFTGGEPTLYGRGLLNAIGLAKSLGLAARLVTNGWWANTHEAADRNIGNFRRAGLDEIALSTGEQHARFVPIESVIRAAMAGVKCGLPVTVLVEITEDRVITRGWLDSHPDIQRLRQEYGERLLSIYESPWMPLDPQQVFVYPKGVAVNGQNLFRRGGCDIVLETITIGPDGVIGACCGIGMSLIPELRFGSLSDVTLAEATRKADADPLLRRIRREGPEHILASAARGDPTIEWEDMYGHRCQACIRIHTDAKVKGALCAAESRDGHRQGEIRQPGQQLE